MYKIPNNELYHYGVKGQKWGVRRYQNKDGTLTAAGKKRYDRDIRENNAKVKDKRIKIDGPDANRWAKEDINRTKKTVDSAYTLNKQMENIVNDRSRSKKRTQNVDLSQMTDQELREKINRANLERQYNEICNPPTVSRGREFASTALSYTGTALAITSSALGIALALRELQG